MNAYSYQHCTPLKSNYKCKIRKLFCLKSPMHVGSFILSLVVKLQDLGLLKAFCNSQKSSQRQKLPERKVDFHFFFSLKEEEM